MSQSSFHRGPALFCVCDEGDHGRQINGSSTSMKRWAIPTTVDRRDFYDVFYSAYNLFDGL